MAMRTAALAAMALAMLWLAAPAVAEEIPVWWSPALEIESLDDIDAMLDAPFSREQVSNVRRNTIADDKVIHDEDYAVDCRSHVLLVRTRFIPYRPLSEFDHIGLPCFVLDALSRAQPASVSYVEDFELAPAALDILPPLIRPLGVCGYRDHALIANRDGIGWTEFNQTNADPYYRVSSAVRAGSALVVGAEGWTARIDLLARADLNGDGTQDLLLRADERNTRRTTVFPRLFLIVRDGSEAPSRIAWEFGVSSLTYLLCEERGYRFVKPSEPPFEQPE